MTFFQPDAETQTFNQRVDGEMSSANRPETLQDHVEALGRARRLCWEADDMKRAWDESSDRAHALYDSIQRRMKIMLGIEEP